MPTKISKNFSLEELCHSDTALLIGADNTPSPQVKHSLTLLATHILQPIRDHFKKPVIVTSGYRCRKVEAELYKQDLRNKPKALRDSWFLTKSHPKGEAADIKVKGVSTKKVYEYILENLDYDQAFLEYHNEDDKESGWVHVSYRNRKQHGLIG